jgi:hypothetical protein
MNISHAQLSGHAAACVLHGHPPFSGAFAWGRARTGGFWPGAGSDLHGRDATALARDRGVRAGARVRFARGKHRHLTLSLAAIDH